ncbi:uncharacterized protein LOC126977855 [Leptidea sinapis]|uniref:uncharacterized protein LOC126977855 n=1 Tax=Leptidea sinapis TaxID=189913 RepID=UPI00211F5EA3|nr:uncharacterized protein LOC126977855 [Leptidea sinapis]
MDHTINNCKHSNECDSNSVIKISKNDFVELRTAYLKCQSILEKFELKYGYFDSEHIEDTCRCTLNKKIVFDDEGERISRNAVPDLHTCKTQTSCNSPVYQEHGYTNITLENDIDSLPNDITELGEILKDPAIKITLRKKVVEKLKVLRQENGMMLRFNKQVLLESVKANPDELFTFEGSNLTLLPGYPTS